MNNVLDIFCEGIRLDPPQDYSAQFTYTVDDIRDYAARNTAFSKTITLPFSATNRAALGHIFELGAGALIDGTKANIGYNFDPSREAKCIALLDGIQIFKGVLQLANVTIDEQGPGGAFEVNLIGDLGGLVAAVTGKYLADLDFSAYDHDLTAFNVMSRFNTAPGAGCFYPLIDYGYSQDKVNFPIENFRPAFHVKEYIDKIFAQAGYRYQSAFFSTSFFKRLILPFTGEYAFQNVATVLKATDSGSGVVYTSGTAGLPLTFDGTTGPAYLRMANSGTRFYYDRGDSITVNLSYVARFSFSSGSHPVTIYISKSGTTIASEDYSGNNGPINIQTSITLDPGDYIEVYGKINNYFPPVVCTVSAATLTLSGNPTVKIPIANGERVFCNSYLPTNFLQLDLLRYIIQMFNLMVIEDSQTAGLFYIEPWINFYQTASGTFQDWSGLLDRSKPYTLGIMGQLTAKQYEYKYKEDSDYYNDFYKQKYGEPYGSYIFDTGYRFAGSQKQSVEVGFSPTPLVGFTNSERIYSAICKVDSNNVYSRTAANPRILFRTASPVPCSTYNIMSATGATATVLASPTSYPYAGHLDDPDAPLNDLNFGVPKELFFKLVAGIGLSANLFNVFWSPYIAEISDKDSKLFTGAFNLSQADINGLDFSKIIYIDGALWRLNKVEDFTTDQPQPTKCELLKVIDLIS